MTQDALLYRIVNGRTDQILDLFTLGATAHTPAPDGKSLILWCAYFGDVTAVRLLLERGASLKDLGHDLGLNAACYHGHWRLAQFLIENGADPESADPDTGETLLHSALSKSNSPHYDLVVKVLLQHGADPNRKTIPGRETGAFMRDCRTKGETPLHRAAAYGTEEAIQMLLDAGARVEEKDANGDSPITWASWHERPGTVLLKLGYGIHRVRASQAQGWKSGMAAHLLGEPI